MTALAEQSPGSLHTQLRSRCERLSIPVWYCDANGTVIQDPHTPTDLRPWLSSAVMRQKIENIVRTCGEPTAYRQFDLFEGCRLLLMPAVKGSCCLGTTVAMLLHESAGRAAVFREICTASGLKPDPTATSISAIARADTADVMTALQWCHEDLALAELNHRTLEEFSDKLAQAYEETTMLFRLARLLNYVQQPDELMSMLCNLLKQILPFQWVAIRFNSSVKVVPGIYEKLFLGGTLPCDESEFCRLLSSMYEQQTGDDWTRLLVPTGDELAALAGSEIIAEPITHDGRMIGALLAGNKLGPDPDISSVETQLLDATADFLGVFHENIARFAEQQAIFLGTLKALTASIDAKDPYTCGHSERVGQLAYQMALALNMTSDQADRYRIAGLVHDVGKIGVPEAVLCKPGRLTDEEFDQIKRHSQVGYDILKDIPPMADLLPGVLHHHERWDGKGYPHQLTGKAIPLWGRVLALADSFDAMSSTRSYRPAMPREKVLDEIRRCAGSQFDADLVPALLSLDFSAYDALVAKHKVHHRAAA